MPRWVLWMVVVGVGSGCDVVFGTGTHEFVPQWTDVAAGDGHTCGLREDHSLWCWGSNTDGQLGLGSSPVEVDTPAQVAGNAWRRVATSNASTCAIDGEDALWCWGRNDHGELGLGNASSTGLPAQIAGAWTQVSVGYRHTCGIQDDGSLWCWGDNATGQLGNGQLGDTTSRFSPVRIGSDRWSAVSAGRQHTCGIAEDDSLWCWGRNMDGELGDGTRNASASPVRVGTDSWARVVVGGYSNGGITCGLSLDGHLRCWGDGAYGTIGDERRTSTIVPTDVTIAGEVVTDWVGVELTALHACGRRADGTLWCWGDDSRGQLAADLPTAISTSPVQISAGAAGWIAVATGADHTCAITDEHQLWCVGGEARGQLGNGVASHRIPSLVSRGPWSVASAGDAHTCVLDPGGQLACGGGGGYGQLGDGTTITRNGLVTTLAPALTSASAGATHTCGIATDGTLWCWGYGARGAVGNGTTQQFVMAPVQVSTSTWAAVATRGHTCATQSDGSMWCWGYNYYGQVGTNDPNEVVTLPQAVMAGTSWTSVATGQVYSCGLAAGGGLWCWGRNGNGQLGTGLGSPDTTVPVLSLAGSSFDTVVASGYHTCAWTTGGSAACWGLNNNGELGIGNRTQQFAPVALADSWRQLSPGAAHTCGIRIDGALWCWGANQRGQLGDGTLFDRYSPTAIGTDTDWDSVTAGAAHTCALKTDGSLWCWGANDSGQLLDGSAWTSAPIRIP